MASVATIKTMSKSSCQKKQRAPKVSSGAKQRRKEKNRIKNEQQRLERIAREDARAVEDTAYALRLTAKREGIRPTWTAKRVEKLICKPASQRFEQKKAMALDLISEEKESKNKARPEQIGSVFDSLLG